MKKNRCIRLIIFALLNLIFLNCDAQAQKKYTVQDSTDIISKLRTVEDTSIVFKQLLQRSRKIGLKYGEAVALKRIAASLTITSNHLRAVDTCQKALKICKKYGYKKLSINIKIDIAETYRAASYYNLCIIFLDDAYKDALEEKNETILMNFYDRAAAIYFEILSAHILDRLTKNEMQIARQKTLEYAGKGIEIAIKLNRYGKIASIYNILGALYSFEKNYTKARENLKKSLQYALKDSINSDLGIIYINLGHTYNYQNDYNTAITYYLKANQIAMKQNIVSYKWITYNFLANMCYKTNKFKEAYDYQVLNRVFWDTVYGERKMNEMSNLYTKYKIENAELLQKVSEAKAKEFEITIKSRNRDLILMTIILIISISAGAVIFTQYKQKSEALKILIENAKDESIKFENTLNIIQQKQLTQTSENINIDKMISEAEISQMNYNQMSNIEHLVNELNTCDINKQELAFDKDKVEELKSKFEEIVLSKQLYKNQEISLQKVASELITSRTRMSNFINHCYNDNFNNVINNFRILEATRIMRQSHYQNYTIKYISQEVGFSSISSFNSAFKKITGLTPSQYREAQFAD